MATPVFDAATFGGTTGATSLTIAHTCTGSNRAIYVGTYARDLGVGDVTGVTYNGVALTQIGLTQADDNNDLKLWRLVAPATGANNVVVTNSGTRPMSACVLSLADVDQVTPDGTVVQGATLSAASTVSDTQLYISFVGVENSAEPAPPQFTSTGTNQTERLDNYNGGRLYMSCATQTGTGTVTASYTFATTVELSGIIAVPVNVAGAAASGQPMIRRHGSINPTGAQRFGRGW